MNSLSNKAKSYTQVQIRFNDIDVMGHVNNAVYQYYFDYARMQYFKEVFKEIIDWDTEALILANITIDFIEPILLEDNIIVSTRIFKIGNKSISMEQEILDENTKIIKSKSKSVLVAFSKKDESTIVLPEKWRESIENFEK